MLKVRRTRPHIAELPVHRTDNAEKPPNDADPTGTTANTDTAANRLDTDNDVNGTLRTLKQQSVPSVNKQHNAKSHDDEPCCRWTARKPEYNTTHRKGRVNGKIIQCLADTGSTRTLVDESILRPGARVYQTSCTAATANGAPIQVTGEANCLIEFGKQSEAVVRAIVARWLTAKCILGSDYLAANEETKPGCIVLEQTCRDSDERFNRVISEQWDIIKQENDRIEQVGYDISQLYEPTPNPEATSPGTSAAASHKTENNADDDYAPGPEDDTVDNDKYDVDTATDTDSDNEYPAPTTCQSFRVDDQEINIWSNTKCERQNHTHAIHTYTPADKADTAPTTTTPQTAATNLFHPTRLAQAILTITTMLSSIAAVHRTRPIQRVLPNRTRRSQQAAHRLCL
jgi:hypothetical protein